MLRNLQIALKSCIHQRGSTASPRRVRTSTGIAKTLHHFHMAMPRSYKQRRCPIFSWLLHCSSSLTQITRNFHVTSLQRCQQRCCAISCGLVLVNATFAETSHRIKMAFLSSKEQRSSHV